MSKKPYRHRFEIRRDESGSWSFVNADTKPGKVLFVHPHKPDAVWLASERLRDAQTLDIRSELTIKRADGSIQDKRTFGADPRETKG